MKLKNLVIVGLASLVLLGIGALPVAAEAPSVSRGFDPVKPGVNNRPGMAIETDYYVYGPDTGFTDPVVTLTVERNKYRQFVEMYLYWHNRKKGKQLFFQRNEGFSNTEADVYGKPIKVKKIQGETVLFGPGGLFGEALPDNIPSRTGRYQFVVELREPETGEVIARANALYNWVKGVRTFGGKITATTTWNPSSLIFLESPVNFARGTLRIKPGTVIMGSQAGQGTLVIEDEGKIDAVGKPLDPIIMTSELPVGQRAPGDWGGLVINGKAPTNQGTSPRPQGEGNSGPFGGNQASHNSGKLKYVRVEFAGIRFSEQNELNGIAFQGVGSGTQIDHIQVHFNQDDGVEMFGGTANMKYVLVSGIEDDSLDWTFGWTGLLQHFVAIQCGGNEHDNGIEADNFESNTTAKPVSDPIIYNATWIGDRINKLVPNASDDGALFRRGTKVTAANAMWYGFPQFGINVDGEDSQSFLGGNGVTVMDSILFRNATNSNVPRNDLGPNIITTDPAFYSNPLGRPGCGVMPDITFKNNVNSGVAPPSGGFFDAVSYIGGVDPADPWIDDGWTTFADN